LPIPKQAEIRIPVLNLLSDRKIYHIDEIEQKLSDHFRLAENERILEKPSGGEGFFHNRIRWTIYYLRKDGLVESPKPGFSKLSKKGQEEIKNLLRG